MVKNNLLKTPKYILFSLECKNTYLLSIYNEQIYYIYSDDYLFLYPIIFTDLPLIAQSYPLSDLHQSHEFPFQLSTNSTLISCLVYKTILIILSGKHMLIIGN